MRPDKPNVYAANPFLRDKHNKLRDAWFGLADPDYIILQDPHAYEKLEHDLALGEPLRQLKDLAIGQEVFVNSGTSSGINKPLIPYFEEILEEMPNDNLQNSLFNLASASLKGRSYAKIEGEWKWLKLSMDYTHRWWWVPKNFVDVDKRHIKRILVDLGDSKEYFWVFYDAYKDEWQWLDDWTQFIWNQYDTCETSLGYGKGLGHNLFYYWHAKAVIFEMAQRGLEAGGYTVAFIDGMKRQTGSSFPDVATLDTWKEKLESMARDHFFILPKSGPQDPSSLEYFPGPEQSVNILINMMDYLDNKVARFVLGADLPDGDSPHGAYASAKVGERQILSGPVRKTRVNLEGAMTKCLFWNAIWRNNLPNFQALNLALLKPPVFGMSQQEVYDPLSEIEVAERLKGLGFGIKKSEVAKRVGYSMLDGSERPDEVIAPVQAAPAMPGFSPFTKTKDDPIKELEKVTKEKPKGLQQSMTELYNALVDSRIKGKAIPENVMTNYLEELSRERMEGAIAGAEHEAKLLEEVQKNGG
ncbi:MAG: hypothetical protein KDD43_00030 [Bdellovibrionales bacterium]|nr:hypothetical protein [Bdellovibrionales bacterium]